MNINKNAIYKRLIILAIIFSPFTQLRIWHIGISEIIILLFVVFVIFDKNIVLNFKKKNVLIFTKFTFIFILLSFLGLFYNYVILGHVSGNFDRAITDIFAYIMVGLLCLSLELVIYSYNKFEIWELLKRVFYISSTVLLVLFVISRFTSSLFGFELMQVKNFRPLASNIHHVSMAIAPLPYIGIRLYFKEHNIAKKIIIIMLIASNFIIALNTNSFKVIIGFFLGLTIMVSVHIFYNIKHKKNRILFMCIVVIVFSTLVLLNFEFISEYIIRTFEEEDLSGARSIIYKDALIKLLQSPVVGYGPGPHADYAGSGVYSDAHQTFFSIGLQGGILSLVAYIILHGKIFLKVKKSPFILGAHISFFIYALGGDIQRRLPIWMFLILFYYYREESL